MKKCSLLPSPKLISNLSIICPIYWLVRFFGNDGSVKTIDLEILLERNHYDFVF